MAKIEVKKLINIRDSVYGFSNLIEKDLRTDLLEIIKKTSKDEFLQYSRGLKYSLQSNSKHFKKELYQSEPIKKIISIFENKVIVEIIGNLLFESNTDLIQHLEFKNILNDINKYNLIKKINQSQYKLTPIKVPDLELWRVTPSFHKKDIENFILNTNSIPFIPSFEFSRIEKGGYIIPHTDVSRKIASIMIYLPENKEQRDSNLGTTFWKQRNLMGNRVFANNDVATSNRGLRDKNFEIFKKQFCSPINTKFQDKYTLVFFRSNTSWHSFEYEQDDIGPRFSLNINFNFPEIVN